MNTSLPVHKWQLFKAQADIDAFRWNHNLILVNATPTDAALHPSWPQALVQYFLIAPLIGIAKSSRTTIASGPKAGCTTGYTLTQWTWLQAVLSPFLLIMWTLSFAIAQRKAETAGWISVMGWSLWLEFSHFVPRFYMLPLITFQWLCSLVIIIQRWTSRLGDIAYQVESLNGCLPINGSTYLEQGARRYSFRILQAATFSVSTIFIFFGKDDPKRFNQLLALPALAELIYTAVVAGSGTPAVVSGNCLLVELDPKVGFLDSAISTRWKAFASFMGF